jgi:hypothetical protein
MPRIKNRLQALVFGLMLLVVFGTFAVSVVLFGYREAKAFLFPADHWSAEVQRLTRRLGLQGDKLDVCLRASNAQDAESPNVFVELRRQGWSSPNALTILSAYRSGVAAQCDEHIVRILESINELRHAKESLAKAE